MSRRSIACLALLVAGCQSPPRTLNMRLAQDYAGGLACADEVNVTSLTPRSLRLSMRVRDDSGAVIQVCDAALSASKAKPYGFERNGRRADLFVEAFGGDAGNERIATGALLGFDPEVAELPRLLLYRAEAFSCTAQSRLNVPRAFHTATRLPNDQILFVGGVTATVDGSDGAASGAPDLYVTSAVEVYDPARGRMTRIAGAASDPSRAFHTAALAGADGGVFTIILVGGVTAKRADAPVLRTSNAAMVPAGFRLFLTADNADAAPTERLVYDSTTDPPTVTRTTTAALKDLGRVLHAGTALPEGGLLSAGGYDPATAQASRSLGSTPDGLSAKGSTISRPRAGAQLLAIPDAGGRRAASALLVGGVAMPGDPAPPFEVIELPSLTATALPSSLPAFPLLMAPTLALLEGTQAVAARVLIAGGLEVQPSGLAINPPAAAGTSMFMVAASPAGPTVDTRAATLSRAFTADVCSPSRTHFKVAAWNAATLLPTKDRVLVTGGTPRYEPGCNECDGGEADLTCAITQSVMVGVPSIQAMAPEIAPAAPLQIARFGHTQTLLPDGNVLVAGGLTRRAGATWAAAQTEIFNPARKVPPPELQLDGASIDPDDPLLEDLRARGMSRSAGGRAIGSGSTDPAIPCPEPR